MSSGGQGGEVSTPAASLNITKIVDVLDKSFGLVVQWEKLRLPTRLAFGSADLRKVTIRIREQPIRIMETVHDSLATSQEGQTICTRGEKTTNKVLSSKESERLAEEFVRTSLEEIRDDASRLNEYTNSMHMQFRDLRIEVFGAHSELTDVTKARENIFLARLSRKLSKDVKACEADLLNIGRDIQKVEESLNLMTRLWHKIANNANYLLGVGNSALAIKQNPLILQEIRDSFATLGDYFDEYSDKIYRVYDHNIGKLSEKSREQLKEARWRGVIKLEPPPQMLQLPGN